MRACTTITSLLLRRTSSFLFRGPPASHFLSKPSEIQRDLYFSGRKVVNRIYYLSMTSYSDNVMTPSLLSSSIVGGDYAGLSATFSPKSGQLILVPDHLVPEAMLEWGDVPPHLETLTSENQTDGGIERTIITVLPEVGCGIDNLETTRKNQVYKSDTRCQLYSENGYQIATIDQPKSSSQWNLETVFGASDEVVTEEDGNISQHPRRIRILFSVDTSTGSLTSDISMQVERQISDQSTNGNRWTGEASNSGGLDAGTVVKHIGKDIVNGDVFAVKKEKRNQDKWDFDYSALYDTWVQKLNEKEMPDQKGTCEKFDITSLRLPQNILLRYGYDIGFPGSSSSSSTNRWGVEVSQFVNFNNTIQKKSALRLFDEIETSGGNLSYSFLDC